MLTAEGFYKQPQDTSPEVTLRRPADTFSFYKGVKDQQLADRIYHAVINKWFMYSSPVLSNALPLTTPPDSPHTLKGCEEEGSGYARGGKAQGLPISCFLSMIPDSKEGLVAARSEAAWLSMMGGGISVYASNRSVDTKSTGVMAHLKGYDSDTLSYRQTATRRGSMAAYLDIDHPEIVSFLEMRDPTGGDSNKKCFNLNNATNLTDNYMNAVINGTSYPLIDPKHGATGKTLDAREIWELQMNLRFNTGEPYTTFIDNINNRLPKQITNPDYRVRQSNLCNEVTLMTSEERTAVCCLSSLNLDKYDEWKDTNLVADLVTFLDNVLEFFIENAHPINLKRAIFSASQERAIGIGTIGFHSYLQSKSIAFESRDAAREAHYIYKDIKDKALAQSIALGAERGVAPDCADRTIVREGSTYLGTRNSHLLAVAPNASSADLLGELITLKDGTVYDSSPSPSIEPLAANAYNSQGRAGSHLLVNKHLITLLKDKGKATPEVIENIIQHKGSVQQLDFLSAHEKNVFKTFTELNPMWVVELAAVRQEHICQSQSVNIRVSNSITLEQMSDIHMSAWQKGLKGLYYCRSEAAAKVGTGGDKPLNSVPVTIEYGSCLACEG
jgi:ribonucleoside-diphosphate reductase alpha chain